MKSKPTKVTAKKETIIEFPFQKLKKDIDRSDSTSAVDFFPEICWDIINIRIYSFNFRWIVRILSAKES